MRRLWGRLSGHEEEQRDKENQIERRASNRTAFARNFPPKSQMTISLGISRRLKFDAMLRQ